MDFAIARRLMVERQVKGKGINDLAVQQAMMSIPRHNFVEEAFQGQAYGDYPLPIGEKQTISQPYIVALMTEALQLAADHKILEIGTGSGYQAAVLSRLAAKVYSLERIPALARRARKILDSIGCVNVHIRVSDGTLGWKDEAPFDGIIVTAGAPVVPEAYLSQLRAGGRLVIPVGPLGKQVLKRITLTSEGKLQEEILTDCRFVPLIGANGWDSDEV